MGMAAQLENKMITKENVAIIPSAGKMEVIRSNFTYGTDLSEFRRRKCSRN